MCTSIVKMAPFWWSLQVRCLQRVNPTESEVWLEWRDNSGVHIHRGGWNMLKGQKEKGTMALMICKLSAVRFHRCYRKYGCCRCYPGASWCKHSQARLPNWYRICLFPNSMWYRVVLNHSGSTPVAMLRLSLPLGGHNRYQRPWRWWERRSWRCAWKKCVKAAVPGTLLLESAVLPAWSMKLPEGAHLILEQDLVYFLWGGEAEMFSKVWR